MSILNPNNEQEQQELQKRYQELVQAHHPKTNILRNVILAFLVGGGICCVGQIFLNIFIAMSMSPREAAGPTLAAMILLGALATAFGVYDELGEIGGAGAAVPITGFANTIVSAAMEFKREGYILGMGAKMFVVAGPVIVFGIITGFLIALLRVFIFG